MNIKAAADTNKADDDDTEEAEDSVEAPFILASWGWDEAFEEAAAAGVTTALGAAEEGRAEVVLAGVVTLPSL